MYTVIPNESIEKKLFDLEMAFSRGTLTIKHISDLRKLLTELFEHNLYTTTELDCINILLSISNQ